MLNSKKRKLLRTGIISVIIVLIIIVTSIISYFNNITFKSLINPITIKENNVQPMTLKDAADISGFSSITLEDSMYKKIAENDSLILYIDNALGSIKVYDKRSNAIWSSVPVTDDPSLANIAESFRNSMQSILTFKYVDLISKNSIEKLTYSSTEPNNATSLAIRNGIRISYDFYQLNIKISIDITLEDDDLSIKIPDEAIIENETGVDNLLGAKDDLANKINQIRTVCDDAKKEAAASDYSDNKKKIIDLTGNSISEILLFLDEQVGTGNFSTSKIDELNENIERLLSLTDDIESINSKLKTIPDIILEISKAAEIMSKNRSTGITELQVVPYFGAQNSATEGYVFFPDKNGAISYFNRKHPAMSGVYKQDVYASAYEGPSFTQTISNVSTNGINDYKSPASMPVYGIKANNDAFVAIITKGDYDSAILYNPCSSDNEISNVNSLYYIRKKTVYVNENGAQNQIFDNLRTKSDRCTVYKFLNGGKANYSGMAVAYRDYLETSGQLKKSKAMEKSLPLGLEFFMGIENSKQSLFREFITMTKFSDIQDFLIDLKGKGVDDIIVNITNWSERNGVKEPDISVPAKQIGGIDKLTELAKYAAQNNLIIGLDRQLIWAKRKDMSSNFIDIATVKNKSLLTFESNGFHMLNPSFIFNNFIKNDLSIFKVYGINALNTTSLSDSIYFDYNKNAQYDRSQTALIFKSLEGEIQNSLGYSIGEDANAYMLANIDWNMFLGMENSRFLYSDEDVPFYQIVIHGNILYTGEGLNLMYNKEEQMLKYIEYGYIPFYTLTEQTPSKMRNSGYSEFYSTKADDWLDRIVDTYKKYKTDFGDVYNKKIIGHERISDELSKTTYENKIAIYVNYSDIIIDYSGIKIAPKSYSVVNEP